MAVAAAHAEPRTPEPIECWWRSDASAVRVGERFSLTLTCAVLESHSLTVLPDQSRLDPAVVQFAPFEIVDGTRAADLRAGDRRFFQYQYTLRMMANDSFGKDVSVPSPQIGYRALIGVRGEAIEGLARTYVLPPMSMRVLSLVPPGVIGIRDAPDAAFRHIAERRFHANVLQVVALLFVGAAGASAAGVATIAARGRSRVSAPAHAISDRRVLDCVIRELDAIAAERALAGWSDALATRAAAALRIGGPTQSSDPSRSAVRTMARRRCPAN